MVLVLTIWFRELAGAEQVEEEELQVPPSEVRVPGNCEEPTLPLRPSSQATTHYHPSPQLQPRHLSPTISLLPVLQRHTSPGTSELQVLQVGEEARYYAEGLEVDAAPNLTPRKCAAV